MRMTQQRFNDLEAASDKLALIGDTNGYNATRHILQVAEIITDMPLTTAGLHPWRTGFMDGLFDRACSSPWADEKFKLAKNALYLSGYMRGEEIRDNGKGRHITQQ